MQKNISKVHRMDFWAIFFTAEKSTIGFSLTEMLGRYLRKYGVQNKRVFFSMFLHPNRVKSLQNLKLSFHKHL